VFADARISYELLATLPILIDMLDFLVVCDFTCLSIAILQTC